MAIAPILGAVALAVYGVIPGLLRPTMCFGPLWWEFPSKLPFGYVVAFLITWSSVALLRRRHWESVMSYLVAGLCAGVIFGVAWGAVTSWIDGDYSRMPIAVADASIIGIAMAVPSLIGYRLLIGASKPASET